VDWKLKVKGRRQRKTAWTGNRHLLVGSSKRKWTGKRRLKAEAEEGSPVQAIGGC
jgi:hypothetical protein